MNSNDKFNEDPETFFGPGAYEMRRLERKMEAITEDQATPPSPFNYAPKLNGILQTEKPEPEKYTRAQLRELIRTDNSIAEISEDTRDRGKVYITGEYGGKKEIIIIPEDPDPEAINTKLQIERALAVLYINRMELTDGQKGRLKQLSNV